MSKKTYRKELVNVGPYPSILSSPFPTHKTDRLTPPPTSTRCPSCKVGYFLRKVLCDGERSLTPIIKPFSAAHNPHLATHASRAPSVLTLLYLDLSLLPTRRVESIISLLSFLLLCFVAEGYINVEETDRVQIEIE